ncbi:LETM1-related biofilm-associated protein [Flavobacterium yafengii]|uniref:LETM1-related biofilm-associated protein n=1 Tax=Flavobacterium yafengii TaxID=3041253 RepID=UPI0024A9E7B4|nr:LETM1-related biofilm-associated protein [Flavobacterium yafengii]MDI5899360.1 LETM1-related biofilm-associated protein [Flavobacterium yafengii]MDI6047983.1 LETM1-related biofilm-associated protein [Flavobacterium yafengii]
MINPSASGWIDKFFIEQKISEKTVSKTTDTFYQKVRETGFIYGHIITFDTVNPIETKGWFKEEISKVALLNTLYNVFCLTSDEISAENFIKQTVTFYNQMNPEGFSLFKKILPKNSLSLTLEKIIDERVQTNDSIISKNFSHLVTNALLFIDVLAFRQYLIHGEIPEKYLKKIEETIVNIVTLALKIKSKKSQYDDLLIKLFEASIRYSKFSRISVQSLETIQLDYFTNELEQYYLIDIAGMALWSDGKIENNEAYFLHSLAEIVSVSDDFVNKSIDSTDAFITKHRKEIPYFNYSNPVKHFYDQTTQSVVTLISRNKNRLIKEIVQSKELMVLLAYSTRRDLDEKEKKKVKKQLLEICKTIPSLTIFLLPGGSLLLPILIKFIPTLLPSAFNENLDNE